jgi:hypothetical protein
MQPPRFQSSRDRRWQSPAQAILPKCAQFRTGRGHSSAGSGAGLSAPYLDPPFNSQATYNVLFNAPSGQQSKAQIEAFEDTWHWHDVTEHAFDEVMNSGNTDAAEMLNAMRSFKRERYDGVFRHDGHSVAGIAPCP